MKKLPGIFKATKSYETWLSKHMPLLQDDIELKHLKMSESRFMFLRATYYRWVQLWDAHCSHLNASPNVLAVGDIHFENFGTWRDCDGRLIWGVNDFDEAATLPAALDVVRLGVSILLAINEGSVKLDREQMIEALIEGYIAHCECGATAFVLEESNIWLRKIASSKLREPELFWHKFDHLPPANSKPFKSAHRALSIALPGKGLDIKYLRRTAGLGSLGRPRVVALAKWGNSFVCREAKRIAPPASYWARGRESQKQMNIMTIVRKSAQVPDPAFHVRGKWIVRRLSPHCCKIDLSSFSREKSLLKLVAAMGAGIANIHEGSAQGPALAKDLRERKAEIRKAILKMTSITTKDWAAWKKAFKKLKKQGGVKSQKTSRKKR